MDLPLTYLIMWNKKKIQFEQVSYHYFRLKQAGTLIDTACLMCNSRASQKGSSVFEPCSTWVLINTWKTKCEYLKEKEKEKTVIWLISSLSDAIFT
jgi:hypothetical protein